MEEYPMKLNQQGSVTSTNRLENMVKNFFFLLLNFLHIFYQYKEMKKQFWFVLIYACCMQILINQLCIQGQSGASYQPEAPGLGHAGQVGSKHGKPQLCVSGVYTV